MTSGDHSISFVVDRAAVRLSRSTFALVEEPFFVVNKAKSYTSIRKTGASGWGGPEWERLKLCEAAIRLSAARARRRFEESSGLVWNTSGLFGISILLELGDRVVDVPATALRRAHTRRMTGKRRKRSIGIDKNSQSILDGIQGPLVDDDELIDEERIRKVWRAAGAIGDRVHVEIWTLASGE